MAIISRQTGLLNAESWTKVYQTFREADFTSYDFETLRKSMIDYIKVNYPEDYNDFTESSEFIALIDLIAFLGQSLAFRTDLNARENFLDTAERRDSVLKLARLVSYNPKRNLAAHGYLKIDSVSTTETIYDSDGIDISNTVVNWDDGSDENWLERFTTIINAALVDTQAVGRPARTARVNGIRVDEYSVNTLSSLLPVYRYQVNVEGQKMTFEAVSATTQNQDYVYEAAPDLRRVFNLLYRNDSAGNDSNNTGFFVYFKQGELASLDFNITEAAPNKVVDINVNNINNSDIWLYSLDSAGNTSELWTQVPVTSGINIIYNKSSQRNLYQVNSRANDQISLVFGDGTFANIPQGNFRLYYRTSQGLTYKITPDDVRSQQISLDYVSRSGRVETVTLRASLRYTVANANARETLDEIRQRAPQQYYTQNRMVTGEDYNILPYTSFRNIAKVQAINRTSSGISRYLDTIDSTGRYSSTDIFADDGVLYREVFEQTFSFAWETTVDITKLIQGRLREILTAPETKHYYYETVTLQSPIDTGIPTGNIFINRLYTIKSAGSSDYARFGSNNNLDGTSFVATTSARARRSYTVTNYGTSSYQFAGAATGYDPEITVYEGDVLNFAVNTPGSPFWIKTQPGIGSTNYVVTGTVSNNGITSGTVTWNTLGVDPGTYYYASENFANQLGNIVIQTQGTGQVYTLFRWILGQTGVNAANGYFAYNFEPAPIGASVNTRSKFIRPGCMIRFVAPSGYYFDSNYNLVSGTPTRANDSTELWAAVTHVNGDGTNNGQGLYSNGQGPVTLNIPVPSGALVSAIVPVFVNSFTGDFASAVAEQLQSYRSFMLYYSSEEQRWRIKNYSALDTDYYIYFLYNISTLTYTVAYRGIRYVMHSPNRVNFYFDERQNIYDPENNRVVEDSIRILRNNSSPDTVALSTTNSSNGYLYSVPLQRDYQWRIYKNIVDVDGYVNTNSILLTYADSNNDGVPDYPNMFSQIVRPSVNPNTKLIFFKRVQDDQRYSRLVLVNNKEIVSNLTTVAIANQVLDNYPIGQIFFLTTDRIFRELSLVDGLRVLTVPTVTYQYYIGRQDLNFQYVHNSPYTNRIDPSISNIIDLYVLTTDYDTAYRQWIQDITGRISQPRAPTSTELANAYNDLNNSKVLTDTMIFNSARFKPLFGTKAVDSLQATFKVVKNANLNISDSDIKSSVITAINDYFSSENWDFGETFYFSELSAYLHRVLSPNIASIVLVPKNQAMSFGTLYQVNSEPYELLVNAATVQDVEIINSVTAAQLNQISN